MKNVLKNTKKVILMVAFMATVMGYANETSLSIIKNDTKRTALILKNVKQGDLLSIIDINGIVLYKELIEKAGVYTKGFDLTELPDGDYIFELDKDVEIKMIPFTVLASDVFFDKEKETSFFKPITREKDNHIFVTKLSLNKEPLDINIYVETQGGSRNYELIHSERIENTRIIERVYKLSEKGNYKIIFYAKGRKFTKFINN